jgi:hypothetical protein
MVTSCGRAGGWIRYLAVRGAYQAGAMNAKPTGAAAAPPRSAYRDLPTHAAAATVTAHHPVSWAITG